MRPLSDIFSGKKAVIFDMDGTLIDSIGVWNEADRLLAGELTGQAPDVEELQRLRDGALRRFQGEENPYLSYCALLRERYGVAMKPEEIYAQRYELAHGLLERLDYKPGADRLLRALKAAGYILVLGTTTRRRSIDLYRTRNKNIMEKAPLDEIFDRIYTCEDVQNIKPDPEIYRRIFAELGLAARECVVFEDSLIGVQAAKAAGIETAAVYDKHSDGEREAINALADWQLGSLEDILQYI